MTGNVFGKMRFGTLSPLDQSRAPGVHPIRDELMWERMFTSESFQQLAMRFTDPVQHDYEVIRGIMLADETIAEREPDYRY